MANIRKDDYISFLLYNYVIPASNKNVGRVFAI